VFGAFPPPFDAKGTFDAPDDIDRLFHLDFSSDAIVPDNLGMTHAAALLGQFTTLSPAEDNLDSDNDDSDQDPLTGLIDVGERLVPGLININTAPLPIAASAAAIPGNSLEQNFRLFNRLLQYRDDPTQREGLTNLSATLGDNLRRDDRPGIESLAELMHVNPNPGAGNPLDDENMQEFFLDGDPALEARQLYPLPELTISDSDNFSSLGDTQTHLEKIHKYQYLHNVFSTRSDVYIAYILLRGYPATDFRNGPVETLQLIVVFDRSKASGPTDSAEILAVIEL
jgi:hypothetical protein